MEELKNTVVVNTECPCCGDKKDFTLNADAVRRWMNGSYVQDEFPELSIDDRERLMSGMCGECWDKFMKDDEDLDDDDPDENEDEEE